jgi:hypothetical protein
MSRLFRMPSAYSDRRAEKRCHRHVQHVEGDCQDDCSEDSEVM